MLVTKKRSRLLSDVARKFKKVAEGDKVVSRWTDHGTHLGEYQGIAPTGRRVSVAGISIDRIENGKVVESWLHWDEMGLLQQLK